MNKFTQASLPLCAVVLAVSLVALMPGPVLALDAGPSPCGNSDCVQFGGLTWGFSETGGLVEGVDYRLVTETGGPAIHVCDIFSFCPRAFLLEPGTQTVSDELFADSSGNLHFGSDDEAGISPPLASPPTPNVDLIVTETGGPIDVSPAWNGLFFPVGQILVTSDTVPEPSTWLLLGSGLAGLVAWRRKKAA